MQKGIYIAASGSILKQSQLDVISQNIANTNTTGYKKDGISFKEFLVQQGGAPDGRSMSDLSAVKTDLAAGTVVRTSNPLDIAIDGNGMIALDGGRYTRRGDLKKDREGYLTTHQGTKVLGNGGPIRLPDGTIEIDAEGKISVTETGSTTATELDTIKLEEFGPEASLTKTGDGQFIASGPGTKSTAGVKQGYLEQSNVDTVKEMVHMIQTMREFETYQKAIQAFDDSIAKVNNEMGRL